ncbi:MAG: FAD-dependent pyridine nucleotide-disulfide oxidoreductase (Modular protein) [Nitrosopumilales archaeon]|nr:MAG: FAD-dependent pyridine nucleotide-disulfide oxidoreductase (Modular protein) [Nitrosopumilales archaeon]
MSHSKKKSRHLRVNFSLRKEIFFVAVGSIIGAFTMHLPRILLDITTETQYLITLLVMASVVGSSSPEVGFALHIAVATIIGIVTGIFLHRIIKFNISKIKNGLIYGLFAGVIVFAVFAIPVSQLFLGPNMAELLVELDPEMTLIEASEVVNQNFVPGLIDLFSIHLIWGITVGVLASLFTRKIGANYRCHICDIEFSKMSTYEKHDENIHENPSPSIKRILILGGGYAGVNVLKQLQETFESDTEVSISLVSQDNFFLHTPLLPEMATGMLASRHIATPIRSFCKRARYYQAKVDSIDLNDNKVTISRALDSQKRELEFDYLVIALGGKTNFFGNKNIEKHALTIKTLGDAIVMRNHIISILESADQEEDPNVLSKLMTFVVVGGGFSGVETVGEINDFVKESVEKFYRNIDPEKIRIILVSAGEKILPEIGDLGEYAMESLTKNGVEIIKNTKLVDAEPEQISLDNGMKIPYSTLVWAGGVTVDPVVSKLDTEHSPRDNILVDKFLRIKNHPKVFALGDCASITDERTGKPYPPTAQHAVREARIASENITSSIKGNDSQKPFVYQSKGSMAKIGKRNGVALLMGRRIHGFTAWFLWRQYYLSTLPSAEKKFRVAIDWFADLFFPRDITILSGVK